MFLGCCVRVMEEVEHEREREKVGGEEGEYV